MLLTLFNRIYCERYCDSDTERLCRVCHADPLLLLGQSSPHSPHWLRGHRDPDLLHPRTLYIRIDQVIKYLSY